MPFYTVCACASPVDPCVKFVKLEIVTPELVVREKQLDRSSGLLCSPHGPVVSGREQDHYFTFANQFDVLCPPGR